MTGGPKRRRPDGHVDDPRRHLLLGHDGGAVVGPRAPGRRPIGRAAREQCGSSERKQRCNGRRGQAHRGAAPRSNMRRSSVAATRSNLA